MTFEAYKGVLVRCKWEVPFNIVPTLDEASVFTKTTQKRIFVHFSEPYPQFYIFMKFSIIFVQFSVYGGTIK